MFAGDRVSTWVNRTRFWVGRNCGRKIGYWVRSVFSWTVRTLQAFVALVLENELQYHGLAVCINSANDACISCENFVKFSPVTPDLTELICEHLVRHCQKTGLFCRISPDLLDRFSQSLRHMRALWVHMINLDIIFRFGKGRCHGNQIMLL